MEYLLIVFRTLFFIFTFYFIFLKIVNSIRKKTWDMLSISSNHSFIFLLFMVKYKMIV